MKHLPSENKVAMAVGIQFSVGLSALGCELNQIKQALQQPQQTLTLRNDLIADRDVWVGQYTHPLCSYVPDALRSVNSRNLRFALTALSKIEKELKAYTASFENKRLAIVVGTSTSGIADNELLLKQYFQGQTDLSISHYPQEMSCLAKALQQYLGWEGPAYTISTACSSSAKALAAGQRLLHADLADVVLVGGVDTLCKLTLNGFNSLESLSEHICQPCGVNRDGINIGEAAAFFVLSKEQASVMLMGAGESMDAWHISAPHPEGKGAALAMQRALDMAHISAQEIGYINLHGTATPQNDAMEIKAVKQVFGDYQVALSSTKHKTGHCLGAAGAIEAFICEQVLKDQSWLPLHQSVEVDPDLADQNYVQEAELKQSIRYVMSNSFAFGGSNISLVLGVKP